MGGFSACGILSLRWADTGGGSAIPRPPETWGHVSEFSSLVYNVLLPCGLKAPEVPEGFSYTVTEGKTDSPELSLM